MIIIKQLLIQYSVNHIMRVIWEGVNCRQDSFSIVDKYKRLGRGMKGIKRFVFRVQCLQLSLIT